MFSKNAESPQKYHKKKRHIFYKLFRARYRSGKQVSLHRINPFYRKLPTCTVCVDYLLGRTYLHTDNENTKECLRVLGIDADDFDKFSDEQVSAIQATLIALIDSFKKTNNKK